MDVVYQVIYHIPVYGDLQEQALNLLNKLKKFLPRDGKCLKMDCFLCFVATSKGLSKDAFEPTYAVQPLLHLLHVEVMLLLWVKYF